MIETHCHLDYLKAEPLEELRKKIRDAGITKVITIGVDPGNLDTVMELSARHSEIYFSQGIHPHDAREATAGDFQKIRERVSLPKMVAIGEIGLDYHYNNSPPEIQRKVFERQLEIAAELDMPVIVHTRDADDDTRAILKSFAPHLRRKGVIHSFTSSLELAEFVLSEGFYIGFNGIITFKKSENVQAVVKLTPTSRILFETDSPFLTPVPHRGKENAPYYLPLVAAKIAELKKVELALLEQEVLENSLRCFPRLSEPT